MSLGSGHVQGRPTVVIWQVHVHALQNVSKNQHFSTDNLSARSAARVLPFQRTQVSIRRREQDVDHMLSMSFQVSLTGVDLVGVTVAQAIVIVKVESFDQLLKYSKSTFQSSI